MLMAGAGSITELAIYWVLIQAATNFVFTPMTVHIPERVPVARRGIFSAAIGISHLVGVVLGQTVGAAFARRLLLGYVVVSVLLAISVVVFLVANRRSNVGVPKPAFSLLTLLTTFWVNPVRHPNFGWTFLGRFLYLRLRGRDGGRRHVADGVPDLRGDARLQLPCGTRSTYGSGTLTGFSPMQQGVGPNLPHVEKLSPPYLYRADQLYGGQDPTDFLIDELERTIQRIGPGNVAAMIGEPVMGGGGVLAPPADYWPRVRETLARHGILLIADEVVTAYSRTGHWFDSPERGMDADLIGPGGGRQDGVVRRGRGATPRPRSAGSVSAARTLAPPGAWAGDAALPGPRRNCLHLRCVDGLSDAGWAGS